MIPFLTYSRTLTSFQHGYIIFESIYYYYFHIEEKILEYDIDCDRDCLKMFIMKLTMNIVFEEKKFSLIFCANLYLILNIPLKDVEKSLKSKYLIRTYNKTSHTTWTFDTKIWVICLYNLYYYNKFKIHLVWLFFWDTFFSRSYVDSWAFSPHFIHLQKDNDITQILSNCNARFYEFCEEIISLWFIINFIIVFSYFMCHNILYIYFMLTADYLNIYFSDLRWFVDWTKMLLEKIYVSYGRLIITR